MVDAVVSDVRELPVARKRQTRRFFQRKSTIAFFMALPLIALIFGLVLYPAGYAIHLATLNKSMQRFVGLSNFTFLFKRETFWMVVQQSCIFALTAVLFKALIGFIVAHFVHNVPANKQRRWRGVLLIPWVIPPAMSTLASSINSLASTSAYDFWAPLVGAERDERRVLRAGRAFSLLWACLLVGGAIVFTRLPRDAAAVEVALGIASVVYGGLLGAFALGVLSWRADQRSVIAGMALGVGTVAVIWRTVPSVAFPWYVLIGSTITFAVGHLLGRATGEPGDRAAAAADLRRAA